MKAFVVLAVLVVAVSGSSYSSRNFGHRRSFGSPSSSHFQSFSSAKTGDYSSFVDHSGSKNYGGKRSGLYSTGGKSSGSFSIGQLYSPQQTYGSKQSYSTSSLMPYEEFYVVDSGKKTTIDVIEPTTSFHSSSYKQPSSSYTSGKKYAYTSAPKDVVQVIETVKTSNSPQFLYEQVASPVQYFSSGKLGGYGLGSGYAHAEKIEYASVPKQSGFVATYPKQTEKLVYTDVHYTAPKVKEVVYTQSAYQPQAVSYVETVKTTSQAQAFVYTEEGFEILSFSADCRECSGRGQKPICGSDGQTYTNQCMLRCRNFNANDLSKCRVTANGAEYRGRAATTQSGRSCKSWSRNTNTYKPDASTNFGDPVVGHNFPEGAVRGSYCRNPDKTSLGPWCYTGYGDSTKFDFCSIPLCQNVVTIQYSGACAVQQGTVLLAKQPAKETIVVVENQQPTFGVVQNYGQYAVSSSKNQYNPGFYVSKTASKGPIDLSQVTVVEQQQTVTTVEAHCSYCNNQEVALVCGSDGVTYRNRCSLQCTNDFYRNKHITFQYSGSCQPTFVQKKACSFDHLASVSCPLLKAEGFCDTQAPLMTRICAGTCAFPCGQF